MSKETSAPRRAIVYCIVPEDLADKLHDPLRRHFAAIPGVQVVVEQRWRDRRRAADRRADEGEPPALERRQVRAVQGRRVADRRASTIDVELPGGLPRKARPHAQQLTIVERLEPSSEMLEDRDTARLVARFQAGDSEVFAELYMRYFERVYAYVRAILDDRHAAEDVTQQVFMQALTALGGYERRSQPFRAWLFRIVRNCAIDSLNRRSRQTPLDPAVLDVKRDELIEDAAPLDALRWISDAELMVLIERLPLPQRQVLLLRFMCDLTARQIGVILDRREDDVRALQYRALSFLRERLASLGRTSRSRGRIPMQRSRVKNNVLRARRTALLR